MKNLLAALLVLTAPFARAQDHMDLHLVLAFDVSASVNNVEFNLQRQGTAEALRDPSVAAAVAQAPGGIAISIVQWSSTTRQALGLDWVVLKSIEDVAAYADSVHLMPRRLPGGGTMVHSGLEFAERQFQTAPGIPRRRVIDLSGNGQTDDLDEMLATRDRLARAGIVINALAIEELNRDLTGYFRQHLIAGPNAFVVTADEFSDYARAMQVKLLREISGAVFSMPAPASRHRRFARNDNP